MIKAIIFDLDGTLINSLPAHWALIKKIGAEHGIEITDETLRKYNGMKTSEWVRTATKDGTIKISRFSLLYAYLKNKKHLFDGVEPFPHTQETLQELQGKYTMAVATSSKKKYLMTLLHKFNLTTYFTILQTSDKIKRSKPAPDIFLKTAEKLKINPEECVVVEDAPLGITAAKRAGMKAIAVLSSTPKELFVGEATPDAFIENIGELPQAMEKIKLD